VSTGEQIFFFAEDANGRQLWRTDGTAAGTRLVEVVSPGGTGNESSDLFASGDLGYFSAEGHLWRSDGTAAGTFPLTLALPPGGYAFEAVPFGDRGAIFTSDAAGLFVTDGTVAGTLPVSLEISASKLIRAGDLVFFRATSGLWRTDGTFEGTVSVKSLADEEPGPTIEQLAIGNILYFVVDRGFVADLWRSDGTPAGTSILKEFEFTALRLGRIGAMPFVLVEKSLASTEVWRVDGGHVGLVVIVPEELLEFRMVASTSSLLFFATSKVVAGQPTNTLWAMDRNALVMSSLWISPRADSIHIRGATETQLFFQVDVDLTSGLYVTDGTAPQRLSSTLTAQLFDSDVFAVLGNRIFTHARDVNGDELWTSDGTAAGTRLLKNIAHDRSVAPFAAQPFGSGALFAAAIPAHGHEPWITHGTAAGTFGLGDLHTGPAGSNPSRFTNLGNGRAVFWAEDAEHGRELWWTGGSPSTTGLLRDLVTGVNGAVSSAGLIREPFPVVAGRAYLFTRAGIWTTDGTSEGTTLVANRRITDELETAAAGELVYFIRDDGSLWRTDGTAAGTFEIGSQAYDLEPAGDRLFFVAGSELAGAELWVTTGTVVNTRMVKDIRPGVDSAFVQQGPGNRAWWLQAVGRNLFFGADDGEHGLEPWFSDGTSAGTQLVQDIAPGLASSLIQPFFDPTEALDGVVYFNADDGVHGAELWRSDGTGAGTRLVRDIFPGAESSRPKHLEAINGRLFFSAHAEEHGRELWSLTGSGAALVADLAFGADSSAPHDFTPLGQALFFAATTEATGDEPWTLEAAPEETPGKRRAVRK